MTKPQIRAEMRRTLRTWDDAQLLLASQAVLNQLVNLPTFEEAPVVLFYAAQTGEPDLFLLWPLARALNKITLFPRVLGKEALAWHEVHSLDQLQVGYMGLMEPDPILPERDLATLPPTTLVLVPGLAFDQQGNRIGRGGGYYDRFLAQLPAGIKKIGLFFSVQEIPEVPAESYDVRLDGLITENLLLSFPPD
jgi:5-formyltetrahydrofolate cyclo-ligase